jgi:hypothetical protein
MVDFDNFLATPPPSGQSQRTPNLERSFQHELKFVIRTCVESSANDHIKSLPDDAKAAIEDMFENCFLQLTRGNSPNHTPRERAPLDAGVQQSPPESQTLPLETQEQIRWLPMDNWRSQVGEGSNQERAQTSSLTLQPSAFLRALPLGRSVTSPDLPRCFCLGKCECPPRPSSFFNEQYAVSGAFDLNQSPNRVDWDGGYSGMSMF